MLKIIINRFYHAFPAFEHKNYKLYFTGQLVSQIGTWLQVVALGWLVLEMTHSAFQVGFVSALTTLPVLFLSLFAGVIIDHFPKKNLLLITQGTSMIIAFLLGVLTVSGTINLYEIYLLAFLSGVVLSLDSPARQAFVIELVGKEGLASAIAINSGTFNIARVIGPSIGGFVIAIWGSGIAFLINGMSFITVLLALNFIQVIYTKNTLELNLIRSTLAGISYVYKNNAIKYLMIYATIGSIFGWSYTAILPFIVKNIFKMDATSLGTFYGAIGIGAITGSIIVSALRKTNPLIFILAGAFLSAVSIGLFALTTNILFALILLFISGFGLLLQFSTTNSVIQHIVENSLRGRVMGIYALAFVGMLPIGSIQVGFLSEKIGTPLALIIGTIIILFFTLIMLFNWKMVYSEYLKSLNKE